MQYASTFLLCRGRGYGRDSAAWARRNPAWGAGTILVGLLSFMGETAHTTGSVSSSRAEKRRLAAASLDYNMRRRAAARLPAPATRARAAPVCGRALRRPDTALTVRRCRSWSSPACACAGVHQRAQRRLHSGCLASWCACGLARTPVLLRRRVCATERAVERACVACRSARFRRLFPEYCEEHARRVAARSQARAAALRGVSGSQRVAVSKHCCGCSWPRYLLSRVLCKADVWGGMAGVVLVA